MTSLPPRPNAAISLVFASVGVPPISGAPPFTRILPAALLLNSIVLALLLPMEVRTPPRKMLFTGGGKASADTASAMGAVSTAGAE